MRDWLWLTVALLFLAAGVVLQKSGILSEADEMTVYQSECDLRSGPCQVNVNNQLIVFAIEPMDIQVLKPLEISLNLPEKVSKLPESVSVEFEGVNMDMGFNQIFLEPQGRNLFKGSGMLPACSSETMYWLIHLKIKHQAGKSDVQFQLATSNHPAG